MIEASLLQPHPDRRWCALHTRARHEKKVGAACAALKVPSYLPLRIHRTFSGGKVNTFLLPMFPGYVFAAVGPGEITHLKRTGSVAQRIETADEPGLLRDLSNVLLFERAEIESAEAARLEPGQPVMVMAGPLAGVTGVVVRYKNRTRLQISVGAIGQGVLVDVAEDHLLPVPEGSSL
jgi:transcription termination/antitermination protein NusG